MSTHSKKKGRKRKKEAPNTVKEEEKKAKIYKRAGRENQKRRNKEPKEKGRRQKIRGRIERRRRRDTTVPSLSIEIQVLLWGFKTEEFDLIQSPSFDTIDQPYVLTRERAAIECCTNYVESPMPVWSLGIGYAPVVPGQKN